MGSLVSSRAGKCQHGGQVEEGERERGGAPVPHSREGEGGGGPGKAERLRKENLELESKVASHQQDLDFFVSVVKAHVNVEGDAFLNADPCLREIFRTSD